MNRLKELRKAKSLLQKDVADYLGIAKSTYSYWESGTYDMDNESLSRLADFYGVSTDYILGRTAEKDGIVLEGVYFRLASEAQELGLPPEDIQKIIDLYKKYTKME